MLLLVLIAGAACRSIPEIVNGRRSTWVAIDYPSSVITTAKVRASLIDPIEEKGIYAPLNNYKDYPTNFDPREQWPGALYPVKNQGACGACWAFSISESMGARFNIAGCSKGDLSAQDLVSCDYIDYGCLGGVPLYAWEWTSLRGITTDKCISYKSLDGKTPACPNKCDDGSTIIRYKAQNISTVSASQMQEELYTKGPVEISFNVYEDFKHYRSGVYQYVTGNLIGGHSVMCAGWGVEDGVPYWLMQNTWTASWGEKGFFKILRGKDHCGCESEVHKGDPRC